MPVELTIERRTLRFHTDMIRIGRAVGNEISLPHDPQLKPLHATLKRVHDRWIIESAAGVVVRVGGGRSVRFAWLQPGDTIRLTNTGPEIAFDFAPGTVMPTPPTVVSHEKPPRASLVQPLVSSHSSKVNCLEDIISPGIFNALRSWVRFYFLSLIAILFVFVVGWLLIPSGAPSTLSPPQPGPGEPRGTPVPPQSEITTQNADPAELLVLIGICNLRNDQRPHLVGIGWLWNADTVVIPRTLGSNLREVLNLATSERVPCQVCVIQGVAIEVVEMIDPPHVEGISILKLKQAAEITFRPREHCRRITAQEVERQRHRGKTISYVSYARLPKAPNVTGDHGMSLMAYDPNLVHVQTVEATRELEFIRPGHVLKPGNLTGMTERGGLLVDQDRKIVGMTLLESSVLWTADLELALQDY